MKNKIPKFLIAMALLLIAFNLLESPKDASSYLGLASNGLVILAMIVMMRGNNKKDKK